LIFLGGFAAVRVRVREGYVITIRIGLEDTASMLAQATEVIQ